MGTCTNKYPPILTIYRAEDLMGLSTSKKKMQKDSKNGIWPSVDHSLLSPSGHISKRALKAARERNRIMLFGEDGLAWPKCKQPTEKERDLRLAKTYRDLASNGMSVRKFTRLAEKLEAKHITDCDNSPTINWKLK